MDDLSFKRKQLSLNSRMKHLTKCNCQLSTEANLLAAKGKESLQSGITGVHAKEMKHVFKEKPLSVVEQVESPFYWETSSNPLLGLLVSPNYPSHMAVGQNVGRLFGVMPTMLYCRSSWDVH